MARAVSRFRFIIRAFLIVALFIVPHLAHATINNGENAIDILGQFNSPSSDTTADYIKGCVNNGASPIGFDELPNGATISPGGVIDTTNNRLFVSDYFNNRVLVFTLTSGNLIFSKTPAYVLGQPDFIHCNANTTQAGMDGPGGLDYDATNNRLFVADTVNNRVLVFNVAPGTIATNENASFELGHASGGTAFSSSTAATTQSGLSTPLDVVYDSANTRLFVSDYTNNRVMVFNVATGSIANGENAANELGHPSGGTAFTTATAATTQAGMSGPEGMTYDSTNTLLYVADSTNHRVTTFNVATGSIANGESASNVLGQADFTHSNAALPTQTGLGTVNGLAYDSTNNRLFANDLGDNRTMVFTTANVVTNENATDVVGQYNSPSVDTTADYVKPCANDGASSLGFYANSGIAIDGTNHYLYVMDSFNNRVLVFTLTSGNLVSSKTAAYVIGQPDFISCGAAGTTATNLRLGNDPDFNGMAVDPVNQRLFVMDGGNNRVVVYNTASLSNGMAASFELGQPSGGTAFTTAGSTTTQSGLNIGGDFSGGLALDVTNQLLYVGDTNNNRVMVFNVAPGTLANGENASFELGQASGGTAFTTATAATTQAGLHNPVGVALDTVNQLLYAADITNNRVMVFNANPATIANGENASFELGQASGGTAFTTSASARTQPGLSEPYSLAFDSANTRLFVGDFSNKRVEVFYTSSIANGMNASYVLGGTSFTTSLGGPGQAGMQGTAGLGYDSTNQLLYVSDSTATTDNRVMIFNVSTSTTSSSPTQSGYDACDIGGGSLYCWGYNHDGQSGIGTTSENNVPQVVGSATNWTVVSQALVATYDQAACGIAGGALYCWGNNANGELGLGNTTQYTTPQQVGTDTTWTAVSASGNDTCGVDNGKLYCWGINNQGEDGLNNTTQFKTPQQVGALTTWTAVSTGGEDTCGIAGGALYCWGYNFYGELGLGNSTQFKTPQQVGTDTTWTAIFQGNWDTCGVDNGKLYCWGFNQNSSLGLGNSTDFKTPQRVGALTTWTAVSVYDDDNGGDPDGCGIAGGALYCWGVDTHGEVGQGNTTAYTTPQQVGAATNWTSISVGKSDVCGVAGNQLYCWGWNGFGEAGQGNTSEYNSPQAVGGAGSIGNGEDATDELGQYASPSSAATVEWNQDGANNGATALGLNEPGNAVVDAVNHYLYVADYQNNRVLVYTLNSSNTLPTSSGGHTASYVLGQTSLQGGDDSATTQSRMFGPVGLAIDTVNQRLFVAERNNNRVTVFSTSSLSNGENASFELGQASGGTAFTTSTTGHTQSTMNLPLGLALDSANQILYVADSSNHRILTFNVAPGSIANGENASNELGHPSGGTAFTANASGHTQSTLNTPEGLAFDSGGSRLFVADANNNRVMIFSTSGLTNGENAANELGQANFANTTAATTQPGLYLPSGVAFDALNERLFVSDQGGVRVMTYNVAPSAIANGANASSVIGQANYTSSGVATTQAGLWLSNQAVNPFSLLWYDPGTQYLYVPDEFNNRVMVFNTANGDNVVNDEAAQYVLGQANFTSSTANAGGTTGQAGLSAPSGAIYDSTNNQCYVVDDSNNRVMLFNTAGGTIANGENATDLLGQYTSSSSAATVSWTQNGPNNGPTALGFNSPKAVALDTNNHYLYVADSGNARVLVYVLNTDNSFPAGSGGHTATYVLGQTSLQGGNAPALSQSGLTKPSGLAFDAVNQRLFVATTTNSVIVYSTSSISTGMNAANILGQGSFTTNTPATTQSGMNDVVDVAYDAVNNRLFVADQGNNRVLVFNTSTITNGMNAAFVLGQSSYTTGTANEGGTTAQNSLFNDGGLAFDPVNQRLFVTDNSNNRVLVFNVAPATIASNENASYVLGQSTFTGNGSATTQAGLNNPWGANYDANNSRLLVADQFNSRVVVYNVGPSVIANGENASYVLGNSNFTGTGGCGSGACTQSGLGFNAYIFYDPSTTHLFVTDGYSNRVMIFDGTYMGNYQWTPGYD